MYPTLILQFAIRFGSAEDYKDSQKTSNGQTACRDAWNETAALIRKAKADHLKRTIDQINSDNTTAIKWL